MNISSKNKTILLFGDMHQEVDKVEYILKHENYDEVVNVGDELDSFHQNSKEDVIKTCNFIKKYIFKENFHFIWANHTLQYLYDNPNLICSGYEREKDILITKELGDLMPAIRDKFKWYLFVGDYLCSHAGLHPNFLPPRQKLDKKSLSKWLDEQIKQAEPALIHGGRHWMFLAGHGRGGSQRVGGLTWLCQHSEFEPIEGLNQILGHSFNPSVAKIEDKNSINYDIDCNMNQYMMITNGKITIKKYIDL